MSIEIVETKKISLKKPVLIDGLPGLGLVGTISASYLVEKLELEQVGYITGSKFPPLAAVHEHVPVHPARIYASKKHNIIVVISEFIIPLKSVKELSEKLMKYAKKKKAGKILSLGGIAIKGDQDTVYAIASTEKARKELKGIDKVKLIKEGATTGVTGMLLAEGAIKKYPVISLLAEAHENYLDPRAAAMVLKIVKELTELPISTKDLEKEAKQIEDKTKEIIKKAKDSSKSYEKTETSLGPMYR